MIELRENMRPSGQVTVRVWDVLDLEDALPGWSSLPHDVRRELLDSPTGPPVDPVSEGTTSNLVVDNYPEGLAAGDNPQPTHLAFGDGTTAPAAGNDSLNNEVYRTIVGDDEPSGTDQVTSTLLSQNEANGNAIREVGFVTGTVDENWTLLTHAVLADTDQIDNKTSTMAAVFNYTISWG